VAAEVTPSLSLVAVTIPGQAECSCPGSIFSSTVLSPSIRRLAEIPISGGQNYDALLTLSQEAVGELGWWQNWMVWRLDNTPCMVARLLKGAFHARPPPLLLCYMECSDCFAPH